MYELIPTGRPITKGLRIVNSETGEQLFAVCVYDSFDDGNTNFSGLEISNTRIEEELPSFLWENLCVVCFSVKAQDWKEFGLWLGRVDENNTVLIIHKYITDENLRLSPIGDLVNDLVSPTMDSASVEIIACNGLKDLMDNLNRFTLSELIS